MVMYAKVKVAAVGLLVAAMGGVIVAQTRLSPATSQSRAAAADGVQKTISSKTERERVLAVLESVARGYEMANIRPPQMALQGRYYHEQRADPGDRQHNIAGEWQAFSYFTSGDKKRFEIDFAGSNRPARGYFLDDGKRFVLFRGNIVDLLPRAQDPERQWLDIASPYEDFKEPFRTYDKCTVPAAMRRMIRDLKSGKFDDPWAITVTTGDAGRITVRLDDQSSMMEEATFDSGMGYNVVATQEREDYRQAKYLRSGAATMGYQAPSPGVWTIRKAERHFETNGIKVKKMLEVSEARIDGAPLAAELFDIKSLPIPAGTRMIDHHSSPPVERQFP